MVTQIGKQALIDSIFKRNGGSTEFNKKDIGIFLDRLSESISEHLCNGEKVVIPSILSMRVITKEERNCINPQTKEMMLIPSRKAVSYKTSLSLKSLINGGNK